MYVRPLVVIFALTFAATPSLAQIVGGGGGGSKPVAPLPNTSDERIKMAARFAEHYARGSVGTAIAELADFDALFVGMFGKADWDYSTAEEKDEVKKLYIEAMNLASRRKADEKPEPLQPGDMSISESDAKSAKVGITFRVKNKPTRFVLRMHKPGDRWRVIDGYAVGEDSWVENIKKVYLRFRGRSTPVACMRQIHELIVSMAKNEAATRPSE